MKKTPVLLGAVVAVGALYVGSTWYVGKQAQQAIEQGVAQINERVVKMLGPDLSASQFHIQIEAYERGVLSSSGRYVIHTSDSDGQPMQYVMHDHLQHGPFPLDLLKKGVFAPQLGYSRAQMEVTPAIREWFDASEADTPLAAETRVGFGGQGISTWAFAPFELERGQQHISFSGGTLQVAFNKGVNNNTASGQFDRYSMVDSALGEHIELRNIQLGSTTREVAAGHFEHHSTARVKLLTFWVNHDMQPVHIEDLDVALASTQQQHLLDAGIRYDAARILVEGSDLGRMTASGAVNRLDIPALTALQNTYAELARKHGGDPNEPFEPTLEEQQLLEAQLRPILAAGPRLVLDPLEWTNPAGRVHANASVSLRDPGDVDDAFLPEVLRQLVDSASLHLSVDRAMVVELFRQVAGGNEDEQEQAGEFGGMLFDQYAEILGGIGLATLSNGTLSLSLEATPGEDRFVLNGDVLTTDQLMILMLGLMLL